MNNYVSGALIRKLREEKKLTQEQLANMLFLSSKTISKWETGRGFPDISLIEPLASALGISIIELLNGEDIKNENKSANMKKTKFYVCPICNNVIQSIGEVVVSCCGLNLVAEEADNCDDKHIINVETVEDEYYVSVNHPMSKDHNIIFIAAVYDDRVDFKKLYPESIAEARFKRGRVYRFYIYCNKDGLFYYQYKK